MSRPAAAPAYLGIDLGTSGLKLTLVGEDGAVLAESEEPYAVTAPRPGYAETDPREWWEALLRAGDRLDATRPERVEVRAAGLSGQMHGVVVSDAAGTPVRPAMLWPDRRAAAVLDRWRALPGDVRAALANPLVPGMAGPLLSWLHDEDPAALAGRTVQSPKDWLRRRVTGDVSTERSDASATLLWDVPADDWCPAALEAAGIGGEALPGLLPSSGVAGTARGDGPLEAGVPVVTGAADTAAALLALRSTGVAPGWTDAVVVNAGTGIQVVRPASAARPRPEPLTHLYADADRGWYEMLAVQNGGFALGWAQATLGAGWEEAVARAASAPPGSAGALFLPFLTGERGGVAPTDATARWCHLTPAAGRPELLRAAFEGYAFIVRRGLELAPPSEGPLVLSGGGGRDPWLRQLLADVLGRPLRYVHLRSASAVGAAVLAAQGVGHELPVPVDVVDVAPAAGPHAEPLDDAYRRWRAELVQG